MHDLASILPPSTHALLAQGLIPYLAVGSDTGHRLTTAAWDALCAYHERPCTRDTYMFFWGALAELLPVADLAWENQDVLGVLRTDYEFRITNDVHPDRLWYVGNHQGGITISLPDEAP